MPNSRYVMIGFEDLYGGGDLDYNDLLFVVDIGQSQCGQPIQRPFRPAELALSLKRFRNRPHEAIVHPIESRTPPSLQDCHFAASSWCSCRGMAVLIPVLFNVAFGTLEVCNRMYLRQTASVAAYEGHVWPPDARLLKHKLNPVVWTC